MSFPPPSPPSTTIDVPSSDLLTFVFEGREHNDETKPIYIDAQRPERSLNFIQTRTLVRKLIAGLKQAGLEQGDCVLLVLTNNLLYSAIYFSIIGAGGVYLGANPGSQVFELGHVVKLGQPKFIITSSDVLPTILEATADLQYSSDQIFVLDAQTFPLSAASRLPASPPLSDHKAELDEDTRTSTEFSYLTQHGESDWLRIHDEVTAKSTPAAMFSTSGTSGLPKAAVSSHYALVCQHTSMEADSPYDVKRLISLPFFHVFAALFAHVYPVRLGQPLYILPRFQLESYVDAIQEFRVTDTVMAPPMVHALNRSTLNLQEKFDTIRWIGVGGAPIAAEAMQTFRGHLHNSATLSQVWGMTEIGVATLLAYPEQNCNGSIGRPLPGYEMQLVDSFGGIIVNDDEPGELQVRYQGMMTGYKDQPVHGEGEWYMTGDIMTRSEGKYYVVGRSKELIKVNGWQVAPAELEAVLLSHPCVSDVGVIGVLRDDGVTEVPRAYIVRKTNDDGRCPTLSCEEVYKFSRERLASYKALNGGIFFVDYIPRTASGKIQRFKLAQMDNYRRSVTELLVKNNSVVSEHKRGEIVDLKARAEERRVATRRSSRVSSILQASQTEPARRRGTSKGAGPRRRSRASLIDKMRALEASRQVLDVSGIVSS